MNKQLRLLVAILLVGSIVIQACQVINQNPAATSASATLTAYPPPPTAIPTPEKNAGLKQDTAQVMPQFWDEAEYEKEKQLIYTPAFNSSDPIYLQYLENNPTDISQYPQYAGVAQKRPPYNICFSSYSVSTSWQVVGYIDMREQVEQLRAQGYVKNFFYLDAQGDDARQVSDIQNLINNPQKCDILIVAMHNTDAVTPILENACQVMPVIQFDRFAQTDCPVVSERPIGDYAFGISGAQSIMDNLPGGGNVLVFRTLPGVDTLERRWGAARKTFEANPLIDIIGVEFSGVEGFDPSAVVKSYLEKYDSIDAVWMDSGGAAVSVLEGFAAAGTPFPKIMAGEDQQDFLEYWKANLMNSVAPTYPTFQWRTAVLSAVMFLQGKAVQHHWVLPQPVIVQGNLDQYLNMSMPPGHYAMCGCEDMTNYPKAWQNPEINGYVDVIP